MIGNLGEGGIAEKVGMKLGDKIVKVGTTAEATTTVTSTVYWVWSMTPLVRPYNAEMLPNVRPVLINSVV